MKKILLNLGLILCLNSFGYGQAINEDFATVPNLFTSGWNQQNLSTPVGLNPNWFQGDISVFTANSGATNAYIAVNYNSVAGANTISNWLLTPTLNLSNGDVISFYTRTVSVPGYADNLQLRLSTSGASTNVGASNTSVGDFTTLLTEVNPSLTLAGYPTTWTQYTVTITGLMAPTTGRIALRYYVPNGGPSGANSDYIGVDDFVYTPAPACNLTATTTATNALGGGANGTVSLTVGGGTAPYSYMWSNGSTTQNLNMLPPGCYTVVVNDANGCQATATSCLTNSPGPVVYSNSNVVSTYQVVNGGFTPQWVCQNDTLYTDGGIMNIYLEAGATMITGGGIDSVFAKSGSTIIMNGGIHKIFHEPGVNLIMNGGIPYLYPCPSLMFNYTQAPANGCAPVPVCNLSSSATANSPLCFGESSGSIDVTTSGAVAPVTFQWNNGLSSEDLSNIAAGTYSVTITDSNGCMVNDTIVISEPAQLITSSLLVDPILCNGGMGMVSISASGGTPPYVGTGAFSVPSGVQTFSVTDGNGCMNAANITMVEPSAIVLSTSSTDELLGNDGSASVVVSGGTGPFTYSWMPGGATSDSIGGLAAGLYTVTVTDANGCIETVEVLVGSQVGMPTLTTSQIVLYPNPANEVLQISLKESEWVGITLGIYSLEGKQLMETEMIATETLNVSLDGWAPGIYHVRISSANGNEQMPFVKQ